MGDFNRAALFNVGYLEAMKVYAYDCFIFHDVDHFPEDLRNIYKCGEQPRHMYVFNHHSLRSQSMTWTDSLELTILPNMRKIRALRRNG